MSQASHTFSGANGNGPEGIAPPAKRHRSAGADDGLESLIVFRANEAGYSADALHESFSSMDGYIGLRDGKNVFVKFTSSEAAFQAIQEIQTWGLEVEKAKTPMNIDQATNKLD